MDKCIFEDMYFRQVKQMAKQLKAADQMTWRRG